MVRRVFVPIVVVVALVVVLVEVAVAPVTARLLGARLDPVTVAELDVTGVRRPAVVDVLAGRLRDVEIRATGVSVDALELAEVDATIATLSLTSEAELRLNARVRVTEAASADYLASRAPDSARPTVEIAPDGLTISDERVPFGLTMRVTVTADAIRLQPTIGDDRLWRTLGIGLDLAVPPCVTLERLVLGDGDATVDLRATVVPQPDGTYGC